MEVNWKDLLSFNKRERNGILVLSILISLLIFSQYAMNFVPVKEVAPNSSYLTAYINQLHQDSVNWNAKNSKRWDKEYRYSKKSVANKTSEKPVLEPRYFDPNNGSYEDWISIGLNRGQIKSIKKYLVKGGEFRSLSDVSKMYVINNTQFIQIKPYLIIPRKKVLVIGEDKRISKPKLIRVYSDSLMVELNSADTLELVKLSGIGAYYAKKIVRYRERLGGFYALEQLYEIDRMREETVQQIWPFVRVDTALIIKIHINKDSASEMVRHPYITWNMATKIQEQRDFGHKYKSVLELVNLGLLTEELYLKLVPYLEL